MSSLATKASVRRWTILIVTCLAPLAAAQTENRFDRALREYDKAWKTLGDDLVRQYNAARTLRKDKDRLEAMSDEDRRNLDGWEREINRQLSVLTEGRSLRRSYREHYGPKAELIAAEGYTDLLRMDAETYSRSRDSFVLDLRERARGVITDNMINVAEAGARTLYDLVTKRLTMTADWYELVTKQNAETGKVGSRSQAAFNLFTAYLIAAGLKAAPAVLADKKIVGEKLTDLIPKRSGTGGTPTPVGSGAARTPATGGQATTPPPAARSGSDTQILPPPDLPGSSTRTGPGDTQVLPPSELPRTGPNDTAVLPPPELPRSGPAEPNLRRLPTEEAYTGSATDLPALARMELPGLAAEARRVGVPEERVRDLVRTAERTGNMTERAEAELALTKEILRRTGWDVDLPRAEKLALTQAYLHSRRGGLTSGDLRFLNEQVSRDGNYFDNLGRRGNVDSEGNFVPGLGGKEARELRDAYRRRTGQTADARPPRGIPPAIAPPKTGDDGTPSAGSRPSTGGNVPRIPPPTPPQLPTASPSAPSNVRPTTGGASASPTGGNVSVGEPYDKTTEVIPPIEFVLYPLSENRERPETVTDLVNEDAVDLSHLGGGTGKGDRRNDAFQLMMIDSATNDSDGVIVLAGARPAVPRVRRMARGLWGALTNGWLGGERTPIAAGVAPSSSESRFGRPLRTVSPSRKSRSGSSQAGRSEPRVKVFLQSLGVSTGEAFQAHFFNEGSEPVRLRGEGIVVEPLEKRAQQRLTKELRGALAKIAGDRHATARLSAYCLEFARTPPDPGMMFRIADAEVQQRFAPMRRILQASQKLQELGLLHPDSDPTEYFHSIRQWALWSRENGFDALSFEKAFVERTKKNFAAARRSWTKDIENVVRGLVPNRWRDIQTVLEESTALVDSAR